MLQCVFAVACGCLLCPDCLGAAQAPARGCASPPPAATGAEAANTLQRLRDAARHTTTRGVQRRWRRELTSASSILQRMSCSDCSCTSRSSASHEAFHERRCVCRCARVGAAAAAAAVAAQ
jgi:hypothetical protein